MELRGNLMAITHTPLASITLTTNDVGSINFTGIPNTYTDLRLVANMASYGSGNNWLFWLMFNNDSSTSYGYTHLYGSGTSIGSLDGYPGTNIDLTAWSNISTDPQSSIFEVNIFSYASSIYKPVLASVSNDQNGGGVVMETSAVWEKTAAISSITVTNNVPGSRFYAAGSTLSLYGILKA